MYFFDSPENTGKEKITLILTTFFNKVLKDPSDWTKVDIF